VGRHGPRPLEPCCLEYVIALLAPGQGAQSPGMIAPWLDLPDAEQRIGQWSQAAGLDLKRLGTTADAEEIKDTAVTQPLVVALSLLVFEQLARRVELPPDLVAAGHSVGELTAACVAGVLSPEDTIALAAARGREMAAACAVEPTGMAAVIGGDQDEVLARLAELGLDPANRNASGQIVAAGPVDLLDQLVAEPPPRTKITRLKVAGAFHTRFMAPAREALAGHAARITASAARYTLLSNADGTAIGGAKAAGTGDGTGDGAGDGAGGGAGGGDEVLRRLVAQVSAPVRWDACMAAMREHGVTATIELPPAGALTGMVKRELKGMTTLAIKKPEDLDAAAELVSARAVGTPA
jgi:[acyl-carrier-protein] S-malonyltransferase